MVWPLRPITRPTSLCRSCNLKIVVLPLGISESIISSGYSTNCRMTNSRNSFTSLQAWLPMYREERRERALVRPVWALPRPVQARLFSYFFGSSFAPCPTAERRERSNIPHDPLSTYCCDLVSSDHTCQ